MFRVLIVDDHPVVRRGLREILADEREVELFEAADPHEALRLIREQRPPSARVVFQVIDLIEIRHVL